MAADVTAAVVVDVAGPGYTTLSNTEPPLVVSKDEGDMTFESTDLGRIMGK